MQRGDWLLASEALEPTNRITIEITPEVNLKDSQPVHIYHAASRTTGKLTLLESKKCNEKMTALLAEVIFRTTIIFSFRG